MVQENTSRAVQGLYCIRRLLLFDVMSLQSLLRCWWLQVAAVNAALGGSPSLKQLPFSCNDQVAAVLAATVEALSSSTPEQAANAVRVDEGFIHVKHLF
jgi:hypothetical protein